MRLDISFLPLTLLACAGATSCAHGTEERNPETDAPIWTRAEDALNVELRVIGVTDLDPFMPESAELVGIAVSPDGTRHVLDARSGLYRLNESGPELVLDSTNLEARYGLSPGLELTDVVGYGPDRFLLTAENDGFLLDLWAGTMQSYFCYLPPSPPEETGNAPEPPMSVSQVLAASGVPVKQRTESVTINLASGQIFAQPQTLLLEAEPSLSPLARSAALDVAGSELFVFGAEGGQPSEVVAIDFTFLAGGMIAWGDRLLLGFQDNLYEMTVGGPFRLGRFAWGDATVTGMALDVDGSLLVLDGPGRRLFELRIASSNPPVFYP